MARKSVYQRRWSVPSSTDETKFYIVARTINGDYQCSCPRWKFRREQCHHIVAIQAAQIISSTPPPAAKRYAFMISRWP